MELKEAKEYILSLVRDFGIITKQQAEEYLGDPELSGRVVSQLNKAKMIYVDFETGNIYTHKSLVGCEADYTANIRALWIYLDFKREMDASEYLVTSDHFVSLSFEVGDKIADVIYVRFGTEDEITRAMHLRERYLTDDERKELIRIIIIDKESQADHIEISGIFAFALVDEAGNISYIQK